MSSIFNFGGFDDDVEPTQPLTFAKFESEVKQLSLFYTATWKIVVCVDDVRFCESEEVPSKPTPQDVKDWTKGIIAYHRHALEALNVDVITLFKSYGGSLWELGL